MQRLFEELSAAGEREAIEALQQRRTPFGIEHPRHPADTALFEEARDAIPVVVVVDRLAVLEVEAQFGRDHRILVRDEPEVLLPLWLPRRRTLVRVRVRRVSDAGGPHRIVVHFVQVIRPVEPGHQRDGLLVQ